MTAYNKLIALYMERISTYMQEALAIPKEWHYTEADLEEISHWDEESAHRVWKQIEAHILKNDCSGLNFKLCPFCNKNNYDHRLTRPNKINPACRKCGYGERHGICTETGSRKSEFQKILDTFRIDRVDICRTLSNNFYRRTIEELAVATLVEALQSRDSFEEHSLS